MPGSGPSPRSPRASAVCGALLGAGALALALWAYGSPDRGPAPPAAPPADPLPRTAVEVSPGACGRGWSRPRPGLQAFALHNTSGTAAEVRLQDARSGAVYGETEDVAPGTTRVLRARLGKGTYAFVCLHDDADAVTGPTVRIAEGGGSGPAAVPVTSRDLIRPALDYQRRIARRLDDLVARTAALRTAVDSGDRAAARRTWLAAHLAYARMGAAYGAFGEAADAVDRTTAGLPGGVHDRHFTGFHRIEYGLWHDTDAPGLRHAAHRLAADVRTLRETWRHTRMDPADLGRRAHEILEDTERFELTGRTDYGSGTGLATARANLDGTDEALDRLRPLLRTRYPGLPALDRSLARTRHTLDRQLRGGTWPPPARLPRARRERLAADLGDALERLASVAAVCDVRRAA